MVVSRSERQFRPAYLAVDSTVVWIVDEVQPVAVALETDVEQPFRLVSWGQLASPPRGARPGSRHVVSDGKLAIVHDKQSDYAVILSEPVPRIVNIDFYRKLVDSSPTSLYSSSRRLGTQHANLAQSDRSIKHITCLIEPTVNTTRIRPQLDALIIRSGLEVTENSDVPNRNSLGLGRMTAGLIIKEDVWLCIRRSPLRPWTWRPTATLDILMPGPVSTNAVHKQPLNNIDISDKCWPLSASVDALNALAETFYHDYTEYFRTRDFDMPKMLTTLQLAGAESTIETRFQHSSRSGLTLLRSTELFDEIGYPVEQAAMLEDDLQNDFLPPESLAVDGILQI